jgi:hypothetical protein
MARWSSAASAAVLGASLLCIMIALATASAQQPGNNMQVINMDGRRNNKFTCADTKKESKRPRCKGKKFGAGPPAPPAAPRSASPSARHARPSADELMSLWSTMHA